MTQQMVIKHLLCAVVAAKDVAIKSLYMSRGRGHLQYRNECTRYLQRGPRVRKNENQASVIKRERESGKQHLS